MIIDAQASALPEGLACDIAVIGSGAAGITLAVTLAARGRDVILIEAGGESADRTPHDSFHSNDVTPMIHHRAHEFRRRGFGGTTTLWGGRCIPLDPIDFEARDWIPHSGWPIGFDAVNDHIGRATDFCEAGPADYGAATGLPGRPTAMVEGVASADVELDRIERFSLPTDFGKRHRATLAAAPTVKVLLNAPVVAIDTDEDGNAAAGVTVALPEGGRRAIRARRVVVAAGGLETPRLLLASNAARPAGLGNERDLVGRFYQTHVEGRFGQLAFGAPAQVDYDRAANGVYCRRYLCLSAPAQRRDKLAQLVLRPFFPDIADPAHRNAVLSAAYFAKSGLVPEYARILAGAGGGVAERLDTKTAAAHLRNIVVGAPGLALFAARWLRLRTFATRKLPSIMLRHPDGLYPVNINAEQVPDRDCRVTLAADRDSIGLPRLKIDWRLSATDIDLLHRGLLRIQAALATSGTVRLDLDADRLAEQVASVTPISHHMGTARMGESAATGVCDGDGQLFGTRGVYICGAATFPTSGFANPTLSIVALAMRLADHLSSTDR